MLVKKGSQLLWRELYLYCTVLEESAQIPMCKQWFPSPLATSGHRENTICCKQSTWVQGTSKLSSSIGIYWEHAECQLFLPLGFTGTGLEGGSGFLSVLIPRLQTWPDFWGSQRDILGVQPGGRRGAAVESHLGCPAGSLQCGAAWSFYMQTWSFQCRPWGTVLSGDPGGLWPAAGRSGIWQSKDPSWWPWWQASACQSVPGGRASTLQPGCLLSACRLSL